MADEGDKGALMAAAADAVGKAGSGDLFVAVLEVQ